MFLTIPLVIPFLTLTYGSGRVSFEIKIVCGVTQLPILMVQKPLPPPPLSPFKVMHGREEMGRQGLPLRG